METFFSIILGLIILVILVVIHELGHAIAAIRNGVVVEEFGIGFPPKAWARKLKNGVLFSINWLPLGGFVKLQGEHDAAKGKGDYGAASFWVKTKILLAGVFMNWVTAALLFTIIALFGLPKMFDGQFYISADAHRSYDKVTIVSAEKGLPAYEAGLASGDQVIAFAGQEVSTTQQFVDLTKQHKGQSVELKWLRDGQEKTTVITLLDEGKVYFGASLDQRESVRSTWSAPIVGVGVTAQLTVETIKGVATVFSDFFGGLIMKLSPNAGDREVASEKLDAASQSAAGPVGILGNIFPQAIKAGPITLLLLTALISLTLAVMNLLPIPSLDGGRWFVTALFRIIKRPLSKDLEEKIHGIGFMLLIGLVILITIGDVSKLFK